MIYDTINPEIVRFILENAVSGAGVLDVGCGTGKLGRALKEKINCHITGIEIDKEAAKVAKEAYDEIMIIDLEDLIRGNSVFKIKDRYDFVILGDILEHTTNPEQLLRYFGNSLTEFGYLIVSIPNVANWMIRLKLLFGNYTYSGGILDKGHLKFFTYKTACKLLEDSGYKIIAVRNNNSTWLFRFFGRFYKRLFAFQFVFKCIKNKETA